KDQNPSIRLGALSRHARSDRGLFDRGPRDGGFIIHRLGIGNSRPRERHVRRCAQSGSVAGKPVSLARRPDQTGARHYRQGAWRRCSDIERQPQAKIKGWLGYVTLATASAKVCARGTSESTTRYSSGVCALPPTGPTAQMVGVPTAAVKPESAQPPVNSP